MSVLTCFDLLDGGHDVLPGVLLVALPLEPLGGDVTGDALQLHLAALAVAEFTVVRVAGVVGEGQPLVVLAVVSIMTLELVAVPVFDGLPRDERGQGDFLVTGATRHLLALLKEETMMMGMMTTITLIMTTITIMMMTVKTMIVFL